MKGGFPLAILVNLDVMMAKRKVSAGELAERIGITPAIRFSTLEMICKALDCQPADILEYRPD